MAVIPLCANASVTSAGVRLTPRQRDVLLLFLAGHKHKEIGARLGLSGKTVSSHLGYIRAVNHCASLIDVVRLALLSGLVPSDRVCPLCGNDPLVGLAH